MTVACCRVRGIEFSSACMGPFEGGAIIFWRRKWQPTPVFRPGKSHGPRSLVGYSPWGCKESDTNEKLHFTSVLIKLVLFAIMNLKF